MENFIIKGGNYLSGKVSISGSKNASLPILAATLLTKEKCIIRNVPDVSDTNYMIQILQNLGAQVERASGNVIIDCENITKVEAPYNLVRKMRASICVMGPLLARNKEAVVSLPGGCIIGDRPVDLHLKGLENLGAKTEIKGGNVYLKAENGLKGNTFDISGKNGATVLGTGNIMMAASLAKGTTQLSGAACEPEVVDLADFLISMGAKISGAGTSQITIEGVEALKGAKHTVIPDRIEAGTFLVAGAMLAKDEIIVDNVIVEHLGEVLSFLENCGSKINIKGNSISISRAKPPFEASITTQPYPGFPTDMQAQACSLLATAPGLSVIRDVIFPQRFMYSSELKRMGADIEVKEGVAIIKGVKKLSSAPIMASDLRASAALVLAGLIADGVTEISRIYHIDRGYEHIDKKFLNLGADIKRVLA